MKIVEHSEWGSVDFYWINLELNEDCSGLRWNGSEKTYDMVNVVNFILEQMRKDDPDFGLEGEMIAQGEEIYDRWTLVIKDGIACEKQVSECTDIDDVLESQEFYDLMQEYRHCPLYDQKGTTEVFERIKDFIKIKVK